MSKVIIVLRGKTLSHMSSVSSEGYCARAILNGGMAWANFTRPEHASGLLHQLSDHASCMGRHTDQPLRTLLPPPVQDRVPAKLSVDPRTVSRKEKLGLLKHYNSLILSHNYVRSAKLTYSEVTREKHYASSRSTLIEQELVTVSIKGQIWAGNGDCLQEIRVAIGGANGFTSLQNREALFWEKTRKCVSLLKAQPVKPGRYTVILDNHLAGLFIHEAFGHLSEADFIQDTPMEDRLRLNQTIGSPALSIVDDPTLKGSLSEYAYDDEGVPASRTQIMKEGRLIGRLHSGLTASKFREPLTGNCVAEDYSHPPIIRMSNFYVEPGEHAVRSLIRDMDHGLYLCGGRGGQTQGDIFSLGAQYGYVIEKGRLSGMIRDITMAGNLFHTLKRVVTLGNDLKFSETGACGKGQINIKSCHGAPHMIIEDVIIGGK